LESYARDGLTLTEGVLRRSIPALGVLCMRTLVVFDEKSLEKLDRFAPTRTRPFLFLQKKWIICCQSGRQKDTASTTQEIIL